MSRWRERRHETTLPRHCEPPGRANARPMTGSAKQSILSLRRNGLLRCARNDGGLFSCRLSPAPSLRGAQRRSNPFFLCEAMDCFASLAMTGEGCFMPPVTLLPSLRGAQRRRNPFFLCEARWIASLRSQ